MNLPWRVTYFAPDMDVLWDEGAESRVLYSYTQLLPPPP